MKYSKAKEIRMNNWENVVLVPEFDEQGVACYRLDGGNYLNEYYIVSEAESRKLLNTPEIVGYEVYSCLISAHFIIILWNFQISCRHF